MFWHPQGSGTPWGVVVTSKMQLPANLMVRGPMALNLTVLVRNHDELEDTASELTAAMLHADGLSSINYAIDVRSNLTITMLNYNVICGRGSFLC